MPNVGAQDIFEQTYRNQLKALLAPHGQLIAYDDDRATLDLGLHLYMRPTTVESLLGHVRVWFQLKGIRATTMAAERLRAAETVSVRGLKVDHVRYWFAHPEPVYLGVYVEALERFVVEDVRYLVESRGGLPWLTSLGAQQTVTLDIRLDATLERALSQMPRHRTLRLDGPDFKGRPLGHRLDPLRCELGVFEPSVFAALVNRLLEAHEFRVHREIDCHTLVSGEIGAVTAMVGRLHSTYEWTTPLTTRFGYDPDSNFRAEAAPSYAHGDVLVVIHSGVTASPGRAAGAAVALKALQDEGVEQALIFYNASEGNSGLWGSWRVSLAPLAQIPQGLGSLAFNVLTATTIYLEFLDRLEWRLLNYR